MNFDQAFEQLLGHEGKFSDHPNDPGGKTMFGVTEGVARENGYTGPMNQLQLDVAKAIYKNRYWDKCRIDELPPALRFDVFDGAVNSGVGQSVKWLQQAVGSSVDGFLGPLTLAALSELSAPAVAARYNGHRLMFMTNLKTFPVFGVGWARRIALNLIG